MSFSTLFSCGESWIIQKLFMAYEPHNFDRLIGMAGFSEKLLRDHFTLYQGYVKNTNALIELLDTKEPGTPEYAELQRRLGWEWNGMRLHELYFGNMTKEKTELLGGPLKQRLESVYGSIENWHKNFIGVGGMRGIGWVVLYLDQSTNELFNAWINEHDVGHLAGAVPLVVMDVFEHAYIADYGINRKEYIAAFMKQLDWGAVEQRFHAEKK